MENNELQNIWKSFDSNIEQKSIEELNILLTSKTKRTLNKFIIIVGTSIIVSIGMLIFLTVTTLNRLNDYIYVTNNILLGFIMLTALFSGFYSWKKIQNNEYNKPLKQWLDEKVLLLSKWLIGKYRNMYIITIPVIYCLVVLSIHIYYSNKTFLAVMQDSESVTGLLVGLPIGLFVSFFASYRIRKFQIQSLNFLKDMQKRLLNGL